MTIGEMQAIFEADNDEYIKFDRIPPERRLANRPDLCAFLMLDRLQSEAVDAVSAAEHDEIWLGFDPHKIAASATEEIIIDLIRCGVRYDTDNDSFAMFV